jgi:predicted nucleic acid-binding protein
VLIVSDTGPLRYLVEIKEIDVLPRLYEAIMTTPVVVAELRKPHFPAAVRHWAANLPDWLQIQQPAQVQFLEQLDEGEATAISLAMERNADAVLIDERSATHVARSHGLRAIGTLAVIVEAGKAGFLDFHAAIRRLTAETRFRYRATLIKQLIEEFERDERHRGV